MAGCKSHRRSMAPYNSFLFSTIGKYKHFGGTNRSTLVIYPTRSINAHAIVQTCFLSQINKKTKYKATLNKKIEKKIFVIQRRQSCGQQPENI